MPDDKNSLGISNLPRIPRCPACGKAVGENDPICPHCSADLPTTPPPLVASEPNPGLDHMFRERTDDGAPLNEAAEMDSYSSRAMWFGICSPCCWGIITGPLAVYFAIRALILVQKYPNFTRNDNCTMKAIVGLIFGGLFTFFALVWVFATVVAISKHH